MKLIVRILTTVLFLLIVATNLQANEVVTIYFAGTSITEDWWDPNEAADKECDFDNFWRPELVATLHHAQRDPDIPADNAPPNHHKFFVDGVCSGCPGECGKQLITCGFADTPFPECRGWNQLMYDARVSLREVLDGTSGSIILNLVGLSRGGILTMMFAEDVQENEDLWSPQDRNRITQINILAFDPVAGELLTGPFALGEKVKNYIGIYATDERSWMYAPSIPLVGGIGQNVWMFRLPGGHETMVGNTQTDGHATYQAMHWFDNHLLNWTCGVPLIGDWNIPDCSVCCNINGDCFDDVELRKVANVTKTIAVELLGSPQWGCVEFHPNRIVMQDPVQINTNSVDLNDRVYNEGEFINAVNTMWDYPHYRTMRLISSVTIVEGMFEFIDDDGLATGFLGLTAYILLNGYNKDRLARITLAGPNGFIAYPCSLEDKVDPIYNGSDTWETLQDLVNMPGRQPIPDVDPLPIIEGQCSAEVSVIPTATNNCLGTILGTTEDPLVYTEQGEYTITWTYDDGNGNTTTQSQTVVVEDTTPPTVIISSPQDDGIYLNTQGPISVEYTAEDNCDDQLDIVMTLDSEEFTGDEIDLSSMPSGTHILVVKATDNSGNLGEDSITFTAEPQPLESFSIRQLKIHWASDSDNSWTRWSRRHRPEKHDRFSIFARFQLPEGYTVQDLEESATVTITMAGESANDTVVFKERTLKRRDVIWKYRGNEQPPGEGMNITKTTIRWPPQHGKWAGRAELYIRGVLELAEGIGKDTEPAEATVTVEVPVSTEAGSGSLLGEETVVFKVSKKSNLWFYRVWHKLPH